MNKSIESISTQLKPVLRQVKRYGVFIFILIFLSVYVYLVNHIGTLIQDEPVQATSESQTKPVSRLKIDEDAVRQIQELEAQNIEVKSLFDQARQNPFTE